MTDLRRVKSDESVRKKKQKEVQVQLPKLGKNIPSYMHRESAGVLKKKMLQDFEYGEWIDCVYQTYENYAFYTGTMLVCDGRYWLRNKYEREHLVLHRCYIREVYPLNDYNAALLDRLEKMDEEYREDLEMTKRKYKDDLDGLKKKRKQTEEEIAKSFQKFPSSALHGTGRI